MVGHRRKHVVHAPIALQRLQDRPLSIAPRFLLDWVNARGFEPQAAARLLASDFVLALFVSPT
jgi:hypothetical protein